MALNVGELVATLTIDDDRYTRGMADAQATSVRMGQTATETSRTVQRANEQAATSYQQLAQQAQRSQSQAETAQTRARAAVENRTAAEQNMQTVLERVGATESERAAAARRYETATDQAARAQERAQNATRDYQRAQERADRATQQFGDSARDAEREVRQLGEASEEAAEQSRGIGEGVRERLEGAFSGVGDIAGRSGSSGGGNFLSEFSGKIGGLAGKGGPIAAALVGVAAVGLAAGAILANAIADGMEQEKQEDLIQGKLGVNEETARRIGEAAGLAYSNGWGESVVANMDTAKRAIQAGILTGEEDTGAFKSTIENLDILTTKLDGDVSQSVQAVGALMTSGMARDAQHAFDLIARASDGTANKGEDLLDVVREYAAGWKQTGFSAEYTMALIGQATDNGVDNADRAGDAIREFGRRIYEEGDTIKETLDGLNLDSQSLFDAFKRGGPDAEAAFDQVFDAIRKIEDPVERATAAQALLGDTAGDFIGAFTQWDPSAAVKKLGDVEGAAANVGTTMSSNTAASFDSAKRSIETSSADIKLALAEAFGPALQDVANWVTTHKPEIIGFFTGLADAGFATLDAILAFTSGSLRALADWGEFVGATMGTALQAIGGFAEFSGGIIKHLPGMKSMGEEIEGAGEKTQWYADQVQSSSEKLNGLADMIDGVRPGIQNMRDDVREAGERAETSARLMQALGTAVVEDIPDEKSIVIDSNTPEQQAALEALGLTVEKLPDGTFKVTANTAEGQAAIDAFVGNNQGESIDMFVDLRQRQIGYWRSQGVSEEDAPSMQGPTPYLNAGGGAPAAPGTVGGGGGTFADGGIREAHDPQIGDGRVTRIWNEPETGGESYIPHAPSKRSRAEQILGITAEKFGFGLVKSFADGGIISKDGHDAALEWARSVDPAKYGMGGFSADTLDCSGAVSGAINKALGLDAFDSRMSTVTEGAWLQSKGAILGKGPEGTIRVGWWDQGGGANGHTAMTFADGTNFESNGSEGVVVGGPTGADDPSFTNRAWFPNLGDLGLESDTGNGSTRRDRGGSGTGSGTTDSGVGLSTDGTKVFVTNWPTQLGGKDERTPVLTAGLKVFANGGIEDHTAQIGNGGVSRLWNEPETGGEGYIPLSPAKRPRSVAITKQIANKFGYQLVPMADGGLTGFGGWQNDDRPTLDIPLDGRPQSANKQRANAMNLLALGVGGLNTLASGFDGKGNFTGQFDTGSNSPAVLEEGLGQLLGKFDELIAAAKSGSPIDVQVDIDQGNRSANIAIMEAGL